MPGHTAAHEKASNKKTTTGSYSRSRNQGGVKTTVTSNNNRTRIQNEKQKEFEKTYQVNEFTGTGKTTRTKEERDLLRLNNLKIKKVPPGVPGSTVLNIFQKARQKNLERNVEYFKGLKSRGRLEEYELSDIGYKEYIEDRMSGKITATNPGSATRGGRDDNEAPPTMLQEKNVGGRTLITEAPTATEIAEEKESQKYDARKTKKKGRRKLIFQQATSKDFTLSKPILLGV